MILCFIYRSPKKEGLYLYIPYKDDFTSVPDELMHSFGKPIPVMQLNLNRTHKLANVDIAVLKKQLYEKGFYLQVPPPIEKIVISG